MISTITSFHAEVSDHRDHQCQSRDYEKKESGVHSAVLLTPSVICFKENRLLNYMRLKTANITMNNISRKDLVIGFLLSVLLPNTIYVK